jgi:hypothetical protein
MRKFGSIWLAAVILAFAGIAEAGVVVDEQQVIDEPGGNKVTRDRTVMIEGDKQKSVIDNGNRTVITDLGKGTMTMVDGQHKTYVELPFPPKMGGAAAINAAMSPTISFKKTGGHDKLIGYSCDNYSGAGLVGGNPVKMSGCFSDSAPGAAEYTKFQREMADKVKGTAMANMGQIPGGVPLRLAITTTIGNLPAGISPGQANKLANRQFVTDTTVSRITTKTLSADSFEVPEGYQKQQLPAIFSGTGQPATPPAAEHKVPE